MIGVWTGHGYDTIGLIFPPRNILGYYPYVGMIASNPPEAAAAAAGEAEAFADDDDIPFVII